MLLTQQDLSDQRLWHDMVQGDGSRGDHLSPTLLPDCVLLCVTSAYALSQAWTRSLLHTDRGGSMLGNEVPGVADLQEWYCEPKQSRGTWASPFLHHKTHPSPAKD